MRSLNRFLICVNRLQINMLRNRTRGYLRLALEIVIGVLSPLSRNPLPRNAIETNIDHHLFKSGHVVRGDGG